MTSAAVISRPAPPARLLSTGARWSIGVLGAALCAVAVAPEGWRQAAEARGQAVTEVVDEGALVAALVHDRVLAGDAELLDAVGSVVRATLRHRRLTARLEDSRRRIAVTADLERARIERDLHRRAHQRRDRAGRWHARPRRRAAAVSAITRIGRGDRRRGAACSAP
jgi:hypothetical protein